MARTYAQEQALERARDAYHNLQLGHRYTDMRIEKIERNLDAARANYGALDSSGQKTATAMEREFKAACRDAYIREARFHFECLKDDEMRATMGGYHAEELKIALKNAGVGFAALDPEGKKSDKEMEQVFEAVRKGEKPATIVEEVSATTPAATDKGKERAA